jgi:hypothetical protein
MRALGAMVAALSLGACAAQPPSLVDMVAQIRGELSKQSCAGAFSIAPGQTQAKCMNEYPLAESKPGMQTAEAYAKQRTVKVRPLGLNAVERASRPELADVHATGAVTAGIPILNSEASCRLDDGLAVDQNVHRCLLVESSAHDELARKWAEFPSADRSRCMRYSHAGGGGTYTDLLTCLEMELYVRNLHAKSRSVANQ